MINVENHNKNEIEKYKNILTFKEDNKALKYYNSIISKNNFDNLVLINQNKNLQQEKRDFMNKINILTKNNQHLESKKIVLQEKVNNIQSTIEQTEKSIENKNREIEALKEKEKVYNELNFEKVRYEKEINNQLKVLLSLNDQINKKNRQIKEDEKLMMSFENQIKSLQEREDEIKIEELKVEEVEKKKKEKEEILNAIKKINELIASHKKISFDDSQIDMEQIISFKLNLPNKF